MLESARPAALVPGLAAGFRCGVCGCSCFTGKSGGPSRHASRGEHQRAVPRPSDIADGLPRPFALTVYPPLIAWRSAPNFASDGAPKKEHPHGLRLRVLYNYIWSVKTMCQNPFFDGAPTKNERQKCTKWETLVSKITKLYQNFLARPAAPGRGAADKKQMPPSCDGRHALAGRV